MPIIQPEVVITPDQPTVRIREAEEKTDLKKILPQILQAQGWGVGTYFNVQFLNHERNKLLKDARFVVTADVQELKTTDNAYTPNTRMIVAYQFEQVSEWRSYHESKKTPEQPVNVPHGTSSENDEKKATIKWNPGKKEHELVVGDDVVFSNADKSLVEAELNKLEKAA